SASSVTCGTATAAGSVAAVGRECINAKLSPRLRLSVMRCSRWREVLRNLNPRRVQVNERKDHRRHFRTARNAVVVVSSPGVVENLRNRAERPDALFDY